MPAAASLAVTGHGAEERAAPASNNVAGKIRQQLPVVTKAELQKHNVAADLWIAIDGDVYDVTKWLLEHPGGDLPLLSLAGGDATDAFVAFHPVHTNARSLLSRFLVARLSDYTTSAASADFRRLSSNLSSAGLFLRKGLLATLTLVSIVVLLLITVLTISMSPYPLLRSLSGALIGIVWIQSGWMGHDSGHYPITSNKTINAYLQLLSGNCLTGVSIAWWKRNHNAHHFSCNSLNYDPDLQHLPFFAVSKHIFNSLTSYFYDRELTFTEFSRFLVSYQHWTFYPVMCFARVNLFAQSIILLLSNKRIPNRSLELAAVGVFWLWYPLLVSCLPSWWERIVFVLLSFSVTGIQHVQFCLNHFSSDVYLGKPKGNDWFEKQTIGTLNIDCSPWMDWFHGGLQFQIEHHLFPRLPRTHLRKIAPFVRELCKKHGLPYAAATFWGANVLTVKTLRTAAYEARKLGADNGPVPKNLVWEAINTHG